MARIAASPRLTIASRWNGRCIARHPRASSSSSIASSSVAREHVGVGQRLRVRVEAEARLPRDGDDADRERVPAGQRHGGVHLPEPAAAQVARHRRPGHARDREVEQARVAERGRERPLQRARRERERAERGVDVVGHAVGAALRRRAVDRQQPRDGVGLVARQRDEQERDPVAAARRVLARPDVRRHHRLQALRRLAAALREAAQRAGARGQHDVVGRHAEAAAHRADVVERPGDADVAAARGAGAVQRRCRARAGAACARACGRRGSRRRAARARGRVRSRAAPAPARAATPSAARSAIARASRSRRDGAGAAVHASPSAAGSRQPPGSRSSSRLPSSATATPSTMQWCILPTSAIPRRPARRRRGSPTAAGRAAAGSRGSRRRSGRGPSPGACSRWRAGSKPGSSTHTGWCSPNGTPARRWR